MDDNQQEPIAGSSKENIFQDTSIEEQVTDSGFSSRAQTRDGTTTSASDETLQFLRNALFKNRSNSTFCAQVLSTQHLFREEMYVNDPNRPIEPDAVEMKLGKITLRRAFSTTSMQLLIEKELRIRPTPPIRASRSWSDFGFWINMAKGQFKRRPAPMDEEFFKISCQIFEMASAFPSIDFKERYDLAKLLLPKYYPNYWNYLSEVYSPLEPNSDLYMDDVVNKFKLVKSCKDILTEEQRYSVFTAEDIGKRRRIPIKSKLGHLNRDFRAAGVFLKEEYPDVFTYLIQKNQYVNFLVDRLLVEKNILMIIEASIQPLELLTELEEAYSNQDDAN
ncbi:hypothetical protein WA026_004585 [Henosepilachna vigintioctopunctata]|uniref:Uncharacterized protein n=1 Tax=Henosepilachna vigintioctopunctata TaxID=420089 RepID=A0AAW1VBP8_9CUCU